MTGPTAIRRAEVIHLQHRLTRTRIFSTGAHDTRDSLLIRVETADGAVGWGETYLVPDARKAAETLCGWLVGQDVDGAAGTLGSLGGAPRFVLSAVRLAVDDARARHRGVPLHALYGERVRTRVRPYASSAGYVAGAPLAETWAAEAAAVRQAGFAALKLRIGRGDAGEELAAIRAAQEATPGFDWMADVNEAWTAETTLHHADELGALGLRWLEEPTPTADLHAYAGLRRALTMPIAGGESSQSPGQATGALLSGAFDIIQPDVSICGGVAPLLTIATAAEAQGVACIPHACNGAINVAATLQVLAVLPLQSPAIEAGPMLEHDVGENPLRTGLLTTSLTIRDGWLEIPDGPGLGVTVDESVVEALRV
jgi:D-galactarolactone cycloisomerase